MRRYAVVLIVVLAVLGTLVSTTTGVMGPTRRPMQRMQDQAGPPDPYGEYQQSTSNQQTSAGPLGEGEEPNSPLDAVIGEPNEVRDRIRKYQGLEAALLAVQNKGMNEDREWAQIRMVNRLKLAELVDEQIREELLFLRKFALEEKATKTAAAIDGVLLRRYERFTDVINALEEEQMRNARLQQAQQGRDAYGRPTTQQQGANPYDQNQQTGVRRPNTRRRRR